MHKQNHRPLFTLSSVRGEAKICCSASPEFRDKAAIMARQLGMPLRDFALLALRDRVQQDALRTPEGRLIVGLRAMLHKKGVPEHVKAAVQVLLEPYMPAED